MMAKLILANIQGSITCSVLNGIRYISEDRHANTIRMKWKLGEPFDLALNDTAMQILTYQLGKHSKYVFLKTKHNPVLKLNYKSCYKALDKALITDFRWHDLRHTWASWLVQNGISLYELKEMGDWQSLGMVQKYAHLDNDNLHAQAAKIDSFMTYTCQRIVKNDITLDYLLTSKRLDNVLNMMQ